MKVYVVYVDVVVLVAVAVVEVLVPADMYRSTKSPVIAVRAWHLQLRT